MVATVEVVMEVWLRISPAIGVSKAGRLDIDADRGHYGDRLNLSVRSSWHAPSGQTLVQYSQTLLGGWLGRVIVLPYFVAWYTLSIDVLRSFADFIHLIILDRTPVWLVISLMVALMAYITYTGGITGIGRFCEIAGPLTILTLIVTFILNVGNMKWNQITPVVYDSGWATLLKGSFEPASFFGETFMLLTIVSFMEKPQKALSRAMLGMGITILTVSSATFMVLTVLGPNLAASLRFPYFIIVRSINILNFVQNVDIFVIFIWVFGVFVKLSLYLFITSYEAAKWLNVKNWRKLIGFGAPLMAISAILVPNQTYIPIYQKIWELAIIPVCGIGIPLILWGISVAKKKSF